MVLRTNLFGYQGDSKSPYLKITVTEPRYINRVRSLIENGNANWKGLWKAADGGILTFDSLEYVLRFMVDTKVRLQSAAQGRCRLTLTIDLRDVMG